MSGTAAAEWIEVAKGLEPDGMAWIGGAPREAKSGRTTAVTTPRDGEQPWQVAAGDGEDVAAAVAAARDAAEQGGWGFSHPSERKRRMYALADAIAADAETLAPLMSMEMGKPISETLREVAGTAECFRFFGETVDKVYGDTAPVGPDAVGLIDRVPLGVVGAVTPWNYPLMMPAWKLAPALAAGNAVVLKPAEQSPLTALRLGRLATESGLPDGVLNVVPGSGEEAGAAIGLHPGVDKVSFTGSSVVGGMFLRYAGESNLKQVALECGGKSPVVVLADCSDLDGVATLTAKNAFKNSGQICNASSRIIVHSSLSDELTERIAAAAEAWRPDDPLAPATKVGPLVEAAQLERTVERVERAEEQGAVAAVGGRPIDHPTGGPYMAPTLLTGVHNEMPIAREELFAPVAVMIEFEDDEEALRLANDTSYGLAAGVWTSDLTRAHRLSRQLKAGMVYVNTWDYGDPALPFGGTKASGHGRDLSLHSLVSYTEQKTTYIALGA